MVTFEDVKPRSRKTAESVRRRSRRGTRRRLLPLGAALALAVMLIVALRGASPAETERVAVVVPTPPPPTTRVDTLTRGETLAEVMADQGFEPATVHELVGVVRSYKNPRTFQAGSVLAFAGRPGRLPDRVVLQLNPDSLLQLAAGPGGWTARLDTVTVVVDTLRLSGDIESSLWFAELGGEVDRLGEGEFHEYVYDLADVFAWKIDFTRDIRSGDAFRVAIERERRPDGSIRTRRFLAIELRNRGRRYTAIPFVRPDGGREYFDTEGEALRGVFLRYPVPFRITSGFSRRRFHPILQRYRAHLGIDYGAPRGTPVKATATGTVTRAGTWGGYGRMVEIRHGRGIRTRYAHLSGIARGVRPGAVVEQGQVIGRVGATGLATASHLHYEFLQNGAHRNPSTVDLPSAPALEDRYMQEFGEVRDRALALLDGLALPDAEDPPTALPAVAD